VEFLIILPTTLQTLLGFMQRL